MISETKFLALADDLTLQDLVGESDDKGQKYNYIVVRDYDTGEVLQTQKNLVVGNGRELTLRKLFAMPYPNESLTQLNQRAINMFGIGEGGAPVASPFIPISPTPADVRLNKEVPFRSIPLNFILDNGDDARYFDKRIINNNQLFYKKLFTNKELIIDQIQNDYYVKITLDISDKDARGTVINELSLFSSIFDGVTYTAPLMATRVTFQSEPLAVETKKGLSIDYYVYA